MMCQSKNVSGFLKCILSIKSPLFPTFWERQDTSEGVEAGEEECNATGEGEVNEETSGADTTGDGNVYEEESGDYTTDEGQEGDSKLEEWDTSREGQDMLGGRVVGYLGDSFGSSGVGDISGGGLEEGELPQDSSREMDNKGHLNVEERRLREMSWEKEGEKEEGSTEEEDNCSSISMSTVF